MSVRTLRVAEEDLGEAGRITTAGGDVGLCGDRSGPIGPEEVGSEGCGDFTASLADEYDVMRETAVVDGAPVIVGATGADFVATAAAAAAEEAVTEEAVTEEAAAPFTIAA